MSMTWPVLFSRSSRYLLWRAASARSSGDCWALMSIAIGPSLSRRGARHDAAGGRPATVDSADSAVSHVQRPVPRPVEGEAAPAATARHVRMHRLRREQHVEGPDQHLLDGGGHVVLPP